MTTSSNQNTHIRLGDLLMEAGILTSDYIVQALSRYEEQGLPLGKVLIMSGYLNDLEVRNALSLQYMVNDRLLTLSDAVAVLKSSHGTGLSLEEAFLKSGIIQPEEQETNKLGQFLIVSHLLPPDKLNECLQSSSQSGLPLGHILCFLGLVSQPIINKALLVQQYVRRGQILRKQGIDSLIEAGERERRLEAFEINRGFKRIPLKGTPLFGELLILASTAGERQMNESLLASVVGQKTIGATLVEMGQIPESFAVTTMVVQEMLDNKLIDLDTARQALIEVRAKQLGIVRALAQVLSFRQRDNPSRRLIELLSSAGLLDVRSLPSEIQEHVAVNYNQTSYVCNALLSQQLIEEKHLFGALFCVEMIDKQLIAEENAKAALDFARQADLEVDYVLYMIGVMERTRLREQEKILPA